MKKLIYSLAMVLVGLTSCTSFDDPTTENYGAGPSVDVTITAGTPSDSAFTVVITPSAGSLYYAYAIGKSAAPQAIDSTTLYKGGYGNSVIKVADKATTTINITDADPNTTYYVYAVAGSDKGIVGNMTVKGITTTDVLSPGPKTIQKDEDNAAVMLTFSEAITRGEGAVTAKYYKEWNVLNPVDVPAENIAVQVQGKSVIFAADEIPAGAYVCFSYEAGAFKDSKGNPCRALNSGLNMTTGEFAGAWVHVTNAPFEIDDEQVTAPENGALFSDWKSFKAEITFEFDVYRIDEKVEAGDVTAVYTNDNSMTVYKLAPNQWSVEGKKAYFSLPVEPKVGDKVSFILGEGIIFDVYGNGNSGYAMGTSWLYFAPKKDDVLGTFAVKYSYEYNGKIYTEDLPSVTIIDNASEEDPTGVIIKNFYLEGSELEGYYDLAKGKLYIYEGQIIGPYTSSTGATYGLVFYNYDNKTEDNVDVPFSINADGTLTAEAHWGIYAFTEDYSESKGWFDVAENCTFTKTTAAGARKAAKSFGKRSVKSVSKANAQRLVKRIRK